MPQVHHSVREMKALDEAKEFGAAGSRAGRSPKGGLINAGSRAPCGLGCRGPEITRGIDASARRSQSILVAQSCQSSSEAANLLQERAAKRRAGVAESVPTNPQDVERWLSEKHLELRDAIEFGDKESILALTDLMQQGVRQCHNLPSTVNNMVV